MTGFTNLSTRPGGQDGIKITVLSLSGKSFASIISPSLLGDLNCLVEFVRHSVDFQ
jgi:hypothetical protein